MDKATQATQALQATRLIKWHRIVLGVMALAFGVSLFYAHSQVVLAREQRAEISRWKRGYWAQQIQIKSDKKRIADLADLVSSASQRSVDPPGKGNTNQAVIDKLLSEGKPLQSEVEHLPAGGR